MTLHVAMIILLSPNLKHYLEYAEQLLNYFVQQFDNIYGCQHVSHNIHRLLHLCNDYQEFGPLDDCSVIINYYKKKYKGEGEEMTP